ncbi:MAG: TonB-dependent receptor [Cyclobacteriaceae bacterium]
MKPILRRIVKSTMLTIVFGFFSFSLYPQTFADAGDLSGNEKVREQSVRGVSLNTPATLAISVSGIVRDENEQPLPGVNVLEKGTNNGTTTDGTGRFSFNVQDASSVLVFSFIGYATQEVSVGGQTDFSIALTPDIRALDEVVVVGYGTQERADLTGSVASVSSREILAVPVERIDQALQGRASGVLVRQNTFAPGAGSVSIIIRGLNSINGNNAPLFVIDGVIGANINALDPLDIQSADVLKDASAASIYGSRAANGVVIVTTKQGVAGKPKITFDAYYGVSQPTRTFDVMNAREYMEYVNDVGVQNSPAPPAPPSPVAYPDIPGVLSQVGEGTDWQNEMFSQGSQQKYFLSISGGSEDVKYSASGGYLSTIGILPNVDYKKFTARFNLDFKVTERLRLTSGMSYASDVTNSIGETFGYTYGTINSISIPPVMSPRDAFGEFPPIVVNPYETGSPKQHANALAALDREIREGLGSFSQFNFGLEYKFTDWLKFHTTLGLQPSLSEGRFFSPLEIPDTQYLTLVASASKGFTRRNNWLVENMLTFDKNFNDQHQMTVMVGTTTQKTSFESTSAGARDFAFEQFEFHNLGAGTPTLNTVSSSQSEEQLASFFGRINYNLDDKYLFQINGRYDGSSKFAPGNQWAFFPSASVGWRLSEEAFIQDMNMFDNMKLRASYGSIGSHGIGAYSTLSRVSGTHSYGFNGVRQGTYGPVGVANADLKWETTTQFDIGLDVGFLDNRLGITLDYYHKKTTDLLLNQQTSIVNNPTTNHDPSITRNIGSLQNTGFEFSVNYQPVNAAQLKWSVTLNGTFQKNKILDLALNEGVEYLQVGDNIRRNYNRIQEGQPFGNFVGYETDGLYQTVEEVAAFTNAQPNARPGDMRYVDQNGDSTINGDDFVILGNAYPDFFGGITNNFTYRNFNLSIFFFATLGQEVFNFGLAQWKYDLSSSEFNKLKEVATDRWTGPGTSNDIPRAGYKPVNITDGPDGAIDRMVEDASFLKLRNITLTYNLPKSLLSRVGINNANIYLQGNNLMVLTKFTGFDPEGNNLQGSATLIPLSAMMYPATRNYMLGIQIGL